VRALGFGAPLRAGYELSKRTVGHDLVFDHLVARGHVPSSFRRLDTPTSISDYVADRTRAHADEICAGRVQVFSTTIEVGGEPNWHAVLHDDGEWPVLPWWKIDIRSESRIGDVKWAWELGRFRHVVILARACWLAPSNDEYADTLRNHLTSFLDQNPPERGVHWYSNLELSLRAYALLQILSLAGPAIGSTLSERVVATLHRIGRHLIADLPYTVSTMRNNHLLGDAIGLCTVGFVFSDHKFGRRCTRIGDRLIRRFLRSAQRDGGTFIEDSISYHRFVVELLSVRATLGSAGPEILTSLKGAADFMARLGVLEGEVPQYGDWDEGRALITTDDPMGLSGSVRAALCLAAGTRDEGWAEVDDEVAWYCLGSVGSVATPPATTGGSDVGGGIARAVVGDMTVYLKAPAGDSHNHADAGAVAVRTDAGWLIGDPGTGTYNGDEEVRNHFRASIAHNVLRLRGIDQLEPHRAFRWKHRTSGRILEPVALDGGVIMSTWHDAYQRLEVATSIVRVVICLSEAILVADFVSAPDVGNLAITFGPEVSLEDETAELGGQTFVLNIVGATSAANVVGSRWSSTYGNSQPTASVEVQTTPRSPIAWSLSRQIIEYSATDQSLSFDGGRVSVHWLHTAAELRVELSDGRIETRRIEW
jgi:hypothetical protein